MKPCIALSSLYSLDLKSVLLFGGSTAEEESGDIIVIG
jgi:hypothetical protein